MGRTQAAQLKFDFEADKLLMNSKFVQNLCNQHANFVQSRCQFYKFTQNQFTVPVYTKPIYCTSVLKTSSLYKFTQDQFTMLVYTKPVYRTSIHKTSFLYKCNWPVKKGMYMDRQY